MNLLPIDPGTTPGTEPRTRTLLRDMIAALDSGDSDAYWDAFERLLAIHSEALDAAAKEAKP